MLEALVRPKIVTTQIFAKCHGDVKCVWEGDVLCPDCEIISEQEYILGVLDRFHQSIELSHSKLQMDLAPCFKHERKVTDT